MMAAISPERKNAGISTKNRGQSWMDGCFADFACLKIEQTVKKNGGEGNQPTAQKLLILKGPENVLLGPNGKIALNASIAHWKRRITQYMFTGQIKQYHLAQPNENKASIESRDDEQSFAEDFSLETRGAVISTSMQQVTDIIISPIMETNDEGTDGHLSQFESIVILLQSRRFQLALNTLNNMLESDINKFGEISLPVALHLHNKALLHLACGNAREALYPLHEALEIKREILGGSHPFTTESHQQLAIALLASGETERADRMFRLLSTTFKASGNDLNLACCYNTLGCINFVNGAVDRAGFFFQVALDAFVSIPGSSQDLSKAEIGLALCKASLGVLEMTRGLAGALSTLVDAETSLQGLVRSDDALLLSISLSVKRAKIACWKLVDNDKK